MPKERKRHTIVTFLEEFFDETLSRETSERFYDLDPNRASQLLDAYNEFVQKNRDFVLPPRKENTTRPFIWHRIADDTAREIGGSPFRGRTGMGNVTSVESILLFHHSFAIPDQIHLLASAISAGNLNYKTRYDRYIDYLIDHKELISRNIISVISDNRAFKTKPVRETSQNHHNDALLKFLDERGMDSFTAQDVLHYLNLIFEYGFDVDPFFDKEHHVECYDGILQFQGIAKFGAAYSVRGGNNFRFEQKISNAAAELDLEDLIAIRLNDEAFARWREAFSKALSQGEAKEFGAIMKEAAFELGEKKPKMMEGFDKNLVISLVSDAASSLTTLPGSLYSGTIEIFERYLNRKSELEKASASNALLKHYHAFLE